MLAIGGIRADEAHVVIGTLSELEQFARRVLATVEGHKARPAAAGESAGPFVLDEARAREWLSAVVEYNEVMGEIKPEFADYTPGIESAWTPGDESLEASVWHDLPYGAWALSAITGPAELFLWVQAGDPYYRVAFQPHKGGYYVASPAEELRHLGDRDATGVDAAVAVLRDMVDEANRLTADARPLVGLATSRKPGRQTLRQDG